MAGRLVSMYKFVFDFDLIPMATILYILLCIRFSKTNSRLDHPVATCSG